MWASGATTNTISIVGVGTLPTTSLVTGFSPNGCAANGSITQIGSLCVGVDELKIKDYELKIYPNPADGILNVEIQELKIKDYKLKIYDAIGQLIREEEITFKENKTTINTKELANGVYVLRLSSRGTGDLNTDSSFRQDDMPINIRKQFVVAR